MTETLIEAAGLRKYFSESTGKFQDSLLRRKSLVKAVDGVDLRIDRGESLGIVGESGCGKSTLGRTLLRLYEPTEGRISFRGSDLTHLSQKEMRPYRKKMQLVLQNPYSSLNPRRKVGEIISDTLAFHGLSKREAETKTLQVLREVGLKDSHVSNYPHEMSGGQRQRVAIARAISLEPEFVILDEVTSSLDVSIQAQIVNLLLDLKDRLGLSYLFISHDLAVVRHICDRVSIMYLGKVVETADSSEIFSTTLHPYTQALVSSIPPPEVNRGWNPKLPKAEIETSISEIQGCKFNPRCPYVMERCKVEEPVLSAMNTPHPVSCHLYPNGMTANQTVSSISTKSSA